MAGCNSSQGSSAGAEGPCALLGAPWVWRRATAAPLLACESPARLDIGNWKDFLVSYLGIWLSQGLLSVFTTKATVRWHLKSWTADFQSTWIDPQPSAVS